MQLFRPTLFVGATAWVPFSVRNPGAIISPVWRNRSITEPHLLLKLWRHQVTSCETVPRYVVVDSSVFCAARNPWTTLCLATRLSLQCKFLASGVSLAQKSSRVHTNSSRWMLTRKNQRIFVLKTCLASDGCRISETNSYEFQLVNVLETLRHFCRPTYIK